MRRERLLCMLSLSNLCSTEHQCLERQQCPLKGVLQPDRFASAESFTLSWRFSVYSNTLKALRGPAIKKSSVANLLNSVCLNFFDNGNSALLEAWRDTKKFSLSFLDLLKKNQKLFRSLKRWSKVPIPKSICHVKQTNEVVYPEC